MTTLNNSYCVPKTKEDWALFGHKSVPKFAVEGERYFYAIKDGSDGDFDYLCEMGAFDGKFGSRFDWLTNEVTATKFLDLLHDRITPWRLEEIGFINRVFDHTLVLQHVWNEVLVQRVITVCGSQNNIVVRFDGEPVNITTFTDLLTLIKFLTPPKK